MKNRKTFVYESPTLKVVEIALEQVIAASKEYKQSNIEHNEMSKDSFENDDDFILNL